MVGRELRRCGVAGRGELERWCGGAVHAARRRWRVVRRGKERRGWEWRQQQQQQQCPSSDLLTTPRTPSRQITYWVTTGT
ncbi:hypothetical protein E2C01_063701 [Portunus trituberculatus]|uniref:Uncharacterized protein n=1 Tax=Portunus trituberculatus TaxID=210409 RepID=A0A5B7HIV5_PORTR|nr:hypothetical protein [Portunus trituberculatus]